MLLLPTTCHAKNNEKSEDNGKTIRVGYEISPGYEEGREGEYKSGYGYEYLQKISRITGWQYEYVYGSFNALLNQLQKGEIDLMGNLSYTNGRAKKILYGEFEQGQEAYYLYTNQNHKTINSFDLNTINGKKIGVSKGSDQKKIWLSWREKNSITCEIVEYETIKECYRALNNGEIDGVIEGRIQQDELTANWKALINFGSLPFYFGVNANRPDLLIELNEAQKKIIDENPFYNDEVQNRYMKSVMFTTNLSTDEKNRLQQGNPIKMGYLKGFPPLCYSDKNGEFKGITADLLADMKKVYAAAGFDFEAEEYTDYRTMFEALRNKEISIAWPTYDDYWYAEQNGMLISDRVVTTSMILVYDGEYTEAATSRIGVINKGSLPKIYGEIHYPSSEIVEFDSYEEAINAILAKKVSSVLYVSTTYNVDIKKNEILQNLQAVILPESFGISLGVARDDTELVSILNKGITEFGESGVNHSLVVNSAIDLKLSLKDYYKQHPFLAISFTILILGSLAAVMIVFIYHKLTLQVKTSQKEKEIYEQISNSDPLTKLYNRKKVFNTCRELLTQHPDEQFVMVHVDMKHFRLYNTFFGDKAGDQLLCDTADLLRAMDQDYEYWVYGRIESDVFCAFFPYDQQKYQKHIESCLQYLKEYRSDFLIEPTLGMYFVTDREMPIEAMFTRATLAAKEVQSSTPYATVVYDDKLEAELNEKQQIINEMQTALDKEQFKVYLQPKYSLRTQKMVGAEALVRWIHPTKGVVSPGKFIPVFESNGFITSLDRYMWEHVCRILSEWKREGKPVIPISVNVSRLSMYGASTLDFLKSLVEKYEIDPKYLELELTESAYMDNPDEMKAQLYALRAVGFPILLDDFGSGYSSLNTLRELPVDVLKLDMKFLSMDQKDIRGGLVISSVVRMSKLLNLVVIAEGVETEEQADFLKGIGCEYVQGFLYARPMPVEDLEKVLTESDDPISQIKLPEIDHIGRIIAEMGTVNYAIATAIPTPLAFLEYANYEYAFLRVNPQFLSEFNLLEDLEPESLAFTSHLSEKSYLDLIEAIETVIHSGKEIQTRIVWNGEDGTQKEYICSLSYEGNIGAMATIIVVFTRLMDL